MVTTPSRFVRAIMVFLIVMVIAVRLTRHPGPTQRLPRPAAPAPAPASINGRIAPDEDSIKLAAAVEMHAKNYDITTRGVVTRLLPDDTEGAKHEKFLIRAPGDRSVMIVYNLDLAPRVPVHVGDSVRLEGEYIWNDRGGLIHWTHHDPAKRHPGGWIETGGRRYQ